MSNLPTDDDTPTVEPLADAETSHPDVEEPLHDLGEPLADDLPPHQADQASWLCDALEIPPQEWTSIASVVRPLPSFDVQSALLALEQLPEQFARAAFEQGFPTSIRSVDIRIDEVTTAPASLVGTHVAFRAEHVEAVVWIESDMGQHNNELRLVAAAETRETASTALDQVAEEILEHSTWRNRPVVLDPTPDGVLRGLPVASVHQPAPVVAEELGRSLLDPLLGGSESPGARILITGPPGSGKTSVAEWLAERLRGNATVTFVPPRVISSPDLIHLAFEVARADAPSVLVFDHLDLILGDRYSMRYPESLAELVTKLSDPGASASVSVIGLTTSVEALDPVLMDRFARRIELGVAPPSEMDERLRSLVDKYADGDRVALEALRSRSRGWVLGNLAELERLVELEAAAEDAVDLARAAARVGTPVVAGEAAGESGTYL